MMIGHIALLLVLCIFSLTIVPVYAEVTPLRTDKVLYAPDMDMYFTGTVNHMGSQIVNLEISNPHSKFALVTGNASESNGGFPITVNANNSSQFSLGAYGATAFVTNESEGKTVLFNFSPNDSSIVRQMSITQNNIRLSQNTNENNTLLQTPNPQHEYVMHEGITIDDTLTLTTVNSTYADSGQPSRGYDFKNILYPAMIICGVGLVGFILYRKKIGC